MGTKELAFRTDAAQLRRSAADSDWVEYLQVSLSNTSEGVASGLSRLSNDNPSLPLARAIETMFQNITVSLMTDPAFL